MKKEVEIKYAEGEGIERVEIEGKVVLKRLTFYEKNTLDEEATDIKFFGKVPQVKVSTSKLMELGILKSIVSTDVRKTTYYEDRVTKNAVPITNSFQLTLDEIRNLPQEVGEKLFETFTELNEPTEKKKETSS